MSLPVELWEAVITFVSEDHDLTSLCLINRAFCAIAQIRLVTYVHLHKGRSSIQFCAAMLHRRDLARRVRILEIPFFEARPFASTSRIRVLAYTRLLVRTLRTLSGLQHLSFTDDAYTEDMTGPLPRWACDNLPSCQFNLHTLSITASDGLPRSFLERQTALLSLEFTDFFGDAFSYSNDLAHLSQDALPNLRNAILTWGAAEHIVPNRPIVGLAIIQQRQTEAAVSASLLKLAQSTGPLRTLSIDFLSIRYNIFPLIANALPMLHELSVGMTLGDGSDFDEWLSASDTTFAFRNCRDLASLRLRVSNWKKLDMDRQPLIDRWGEACPTLVDVTFYTFRPAVAEHPVFSVLYRRVPSATNGHANTNRWTRLER